MFMTNIARKSYLNHIACCCIFLFPLSILSIYLGYEGEQYCEDVLIQLHTYLKIFGFSIFINLTFSIIIVLLANTRFKHYFFIGLYFILCIIYWLIMFVLEVVVLQETCVSSKDINYIFVILNMIIATPLGLVMNIEFCSLASSYINNDISDYLLTEENV